MPADIKVLIVTGGLVSGGERSLGQALRKQWQSLRAAHGIWLDILVKLNTAELLLDFRRALRSRWFRSSPAHERVGSYLNNDLQLDTPELTEVCLATLLEAEGIRWEATTYGELCADRRLRRRLLDECRVVFASSTLLKDTSEVVPMVAMLKRPDNRIVMGGALAAAMQHAFDGIAGLDVLAIGYGELIVPQLAAWIRAGLGGEIEPPPGGRTQQRGTTTVLHAPEPESTNLDFLTAPDWSLAERYHGRQMRMVHYESVRGCPYRCSFCNYPFLFGDKKFRTKSAARIADDWAEFAARGVEFITCLDSLFTMPRRRLLELCRLLIERDVRIKWICYARADDLVDVETCALMKRAGCIQVQIGAESGSQQILDNMNKRTRVDANLLAIANCRAVGITSLVSVIIGFPGETEDTIEATLQFLRDARPDFYYATVLSTRVQLVPLLDDAHRERFGLHTVDNGNTPAPYWRHDTMSCDQAVAHLRRFNRQVMRERLALDSLLFYRGIVEYAPADREQLLDFQRAAVDRAAWTRRLFDAITRWASGRLVTDVRRTLGARAPRRLLPVVSSTPA